MRAAWPFLALLLACMGGCGDGIGHPIVGSGLPAAGAGAAAAAGTGAAGLGGSVGTGGVSFGGAGGGQSGNDPRGSAGSGRERPPPGGGLAPPWDGGIGGWGGAPWGQAGWDGMEPPSGVPASEHCAEAANWDPAADQAERDLFDFLNFARESGFPCESESGMPAAGVPVPPVEMRPELRCAARLHSRDMNVRAFFEHVNPDLVGPEDRIRQAGYETFRLAGETIGDNASMPAPRLPYGTLAAIFASGGRECQNLVDPSFDVVGIGVDGDLFTLDFAGP